MQHNKTFFPLEDGFKQYGQDRNIMTFRQARPTSVDTSSRTVSFMDTSNGVESKEVETIPYYALIIATGTMTPTPTTSFHGDHKKTQEALEDINRRLAKATSVVIAGGGPVAVETAGKVYKFPAYSAVHTKISSGEIGEALNGTKSSAESARVKITVVAGGKKLLPVLGEKFSRKAANFLDKVGVKVVYNTKVTKVNFGAEHADKATVTLDNGETMTADVYIPATGAKPNTDFLPKRLLNERGYVRTNPGTLRVDDAGARVYALGDVGSYTRGGILDLYAATPVFGNNFGQDLGLRQADKQHKSDTSETQIVPVGSKVGVGAFKGFGMPSFVVKQAKGKDFMLGYIPKVTQGESIHYSSCS